MTATIDQKISSVRRQSELVAEAETTTEPWAGSDGHLDMLLEIQTLFQLATKGLASLNKDLIVAFRHESAHFFHALLPSLHDLLEVAQRVHQVCLKTALAAHVSQSVQAYGDEVSQLEEIIQDIKRHRLNDAHNQALQALLAQL